jgi:hypothetical protein
VSNAETASGPTPRDRPEFEEFLAGVAALQRLTDRKLATIVVEEKDDPVGDDIPADKVTADAMARAAKDGYEFRKSPGTANWRLVKKKQQATLRFDDAAKMEPDFAQFCRVFHLDPAKTTFDLTAGKVDPYLEDKPKEGLDRLDLETRSLLQVLFFISHGVELPTEHIASGVARRRWSRMTAPSTGSRCSAACFRSTRRAGSRRRRARPWASRTAATGATSTTGTATRRRPSRCSSKCPGCNSPATRTTQDRF